MPEVNSVDWELCSSYVKCIMSKKKKTKKWHIWTAKLSYLENKKKLWVIGFLVISEWFCLFNCHMSNLNILIPYCIENCYSKGKATVKLFNTILHLVHAKNSLFICLSWSHISPFKIIDLFYKVGLINNGCQIVASTVFNTELKAVFRASFSPQHFPVPPGWPQSIPRPEGICNLQQDLELYLKLPPDTCL